MGEDGYRKISRKFDLNEEKDYGIDRLTGGFEEGQEGL